MPENKQDVKLFERRLSAQAVVCDAADLGVISRPRVWWTRLPWQDLSNRRGAPTSMRWSSYQGIPKVTFEQPADDLQQYDLGEFEWPRNVSERLRPLPCLTTPSNDPAGRPAPRSCRGKVDSQTQNRWLQDNRRYAPWHYQEDNMWVDVSQHRRLALATAKIKEQLHHLPVGWTQPLREHSRHRAIANGWHIGVAKWFFIFGVFCAVAPTAEAGEIVGPTPRLQPSPLGSSAIATMASLWRSSPLLNGPGVPIFDDALDLAAIEDALEHWSASRATLHPGQSPPRLEPGLVQWLPLWKHWRPHLQHLRAAVVSEVTQMVEDRQDEIEDWFEGLDPHVQLAYGGKSRDCTMKLPIIKELAEEFGWRDMELLEEMQHGFPKLGVIRPGLGWRLRDDKRYAEPTDIEEVFRQNEKFVQQKLSRGKVDPCWQIMADEIAADVSLGRMEGPFAAPEHWCRRTIPLSSHSHTAQLLPRLKAGFLALSRLQCIRLGQTARRKSGGRKIGGGQAPMAQWGRRTRQLIMPLMPSCTSLGL